MDGKGGQEKIKWSKRDKSAYKTTYKLEEDIFRKIKVVVRRSSLMIIFNNDRIETQ